MASANGFQSLDVIWFRWHPRNLAATLNSVKARAAHAEEYLSVDEVIRAVNQAVGDVRVPGTPLTLRADSVEAANGSCHLSWSYRDPTGESSDGRIRGETTIDIGDIPDADVGVVCWAAAQLDAAHRWTYELDGDEMPGVPYRPRDWTVDEAWRALLAMLTRFGAVSQTEEDEITVSDPGVPDLAIRLDPADWEAYVALPQEVSTAYIVPTAVPLVDDLPLWVFDEMFEVLGSSGPVIGLVHGKLGGLSGP